MKTINVNELKTLHDNTPSLMLLDVRTPGEFEAVHVPRARLFPLDTLDCARLLAEHKESAPPMPIYILCHSGGRARKAAEKFAAAGHSDCVVVEGGTQAWVEAGLPVERTRRGVLPLDRQLQIAIGVLVLAGVLLAVFVNPAWIWLPACVGCGLIFAGVSGICLMRSALAAMPWNQSRQPSACRVS
jgi:rhodanese-related sulfurtransferase